METKAAKEKNLNSQLEYLKGKPLLYKASSEIDTGWMEMVLNKETVDPWKISMTFPLKGMFFFCFISSVTLTEPVRNLLLLRRLGKRWTSIGCVATFPPRLCGGSGREF